MSDKSVSSSGGSESVSAVYFDHALGRVNRDLAISNNVATFGSKVIETIAFAMLGLKKDDLLFNPQKPLHWILMPLLWVLMSVQLVFHLRALWKARKQGLLNLSRKMGLAQHLLIWSVATAAISFFVVPSIAAVTILGIAAGPLLFVSSLSLGCLFNAASTVINFLRARRLAKTDPMMSASYMKQAREDLFNTLVLAAFVATVFLTMLTPVGPASLAFIAVGVAAVVLLKPLVAAVYNRLSTRLTRQTQEEKKQAEKIQLQKPMLELSQQQLAQLQQGTVPPKHEVQAKQGVCYEPSFSGLGGTNFMSKRSRQLAIYQLTKQNGSYQVLQQTDLQNNTRKKILLVRAQGSSEAKQLGDVDVLFQADLNRLQAMIQQRTDSLTAQLKKRFPKANLDDNCVTESLPGKKLAVVHQLKQALVALQSENGRTAKALHHLQHRLTDLSREKREIYQSNRAMSQTADLLKAALEFTRGYQSTLSRVSQQWLHLWDQIVFLKSEYQLGSQAYQFANQLEVWVETNLDVFLQIDEQEAAATTVAVRAKRTELAAFAGQLDLVTDERLKQVFTNLNGFASASGQVATVAPVRRQQAEAVQSSVATKILVAGVLETDYQGMEHRYQVEFAQPAVERGVCVSR